MKYLNQVENYLSRFSFWILFMEACILRLLSAIKHDPLTHVYTDAARHWYNALSIMNPGLFSFIDAPAYQFWLSLFAGFIQNNNFAAGIYAGLFSIFCFLCWALFINSYIKDNFLKSSAILLIGFLPSWIGIYNYFLTETLLLPLLGLSLWATEKAYQTKNFSDIFKANFYWLFATLTRLVTLPLWVVSILYLLIRKNFKWREFIILCLFNVLLLLPFAYRTYRDIKVWSPFGIPLFNKIYAQSRAYEVKANFIEKNGGVTSVGFASPSLGQEILAPFSDQKLMEREGSIQLNIDTREGLRDWLIEDKKHKLSSLKDYWLIVKDNFLFFFCADSWMDNNPEILIEHIAKELRVIWLPIFCLFIWQLWKYSRKFKKIHFLSALILLGVFFIIFIPSCVMEGRYRKPFEGMIIVSLFSLIELNRKRNSKIFTIIEN